MTIILSVEHRPYSGTPQQAWTRVRQAVAKYAHGNFRFGVTDHPVQRASHYGNAGYSFTRMVVVYQSRRRAEVKDVEEWLIDLYTPPPNRYRGGGGLLHRPGLKYTYIVVA